jgi:hypothetical protein
LPLLRHQTHAQRAPKFATAFIPRTALIILKTLGQVVEVLQMLMLETELWLDMYQAVFISLAQTIWSTIDWDDKRDSGIVRFDNYQVYANVRDAVAEYFANRPGLDQIICKG